MHPIDLYPFKTEPFAHQLEALKKSCFLPEYAYLMEMGTGKSKVILDNICILWSAGKIHAALIIAPKSVYRNWLLREIPTHVPDHIQKKMRIFVHRRDKPQDLQYFLDTDYLNIILINVEAFSTSDKMYDIFSNYMQLVPTFMAIDESTTIKNRTSKRCRSLTKLGKFAAYRRIATGLVAPNGPEDVFNQFQFLKNGCLGMSSIVQFRSKFCQTININIGMRTIEKTIGTKNVEELRERMTKLSYRKTKAECLDLPEQVYDFLHSDLDAETRHHYDTMKNSAIVELNNENPEEAIFVRTSNRVNMLMRLQMISCGHIKDSQGRDIRFSTKRIDDVVEYLSLIEGSVLIWAVNTLDVIDLTVAIQKEYGSASARSYYGNTSPGERDEAVTDFQTHKFPYLVLNQATGRYGNTLHAASTAIYYSNSPDLDHRDQSEARIHRIGQRSNCLYLDVLSPHTMNYPMIMALRKKINLATEVMGDKFREWIV